MCGKQFKRSQYSHCACVRDIEVTVPIVVQGWAAVPCVHVVGAPGCSIKCGQVDDGPCAQRGHRVHVPIVFASMELFICRDVGIKPGTAEHVADDCSLLRA